MIHFAEDEKVCSHKYKDTGYATHFQSCHGHGFVIMGQATKELTDGEKAEAKDAQDIDGAEIFLQADKIKVAGIHTKILAHVFNHIHMDKVNLGHGPCFIVK